MADDPTASRTGAPRTRGRLANLLHRAVLTYRYHGLRTVLWRLLTFPLRFTPLRDRLGLPGARGDSQLDRARAWYEAHGVPVTIVIPTYGPPDTLAEPRAAWQRS